MIVRHQPDDFTTVADRDLRAEGKPGYEFGTEPRLRHRLADHEGAGGAHVDNIEVLQVLHQCGRSETPMAAHVDPSQKHDERQSLPPAAAKSKSSNLIGSARSLTEPA